MEQKLPRCPACGQEISSIRYTEHGTLSLEGSEWLVPDTTKTPDAEYFCPECGHKLTDEEAKEIGLLP